jgi:hypothetical protein
MLAMGSGSWLCISKRLCEQEKVRVLNEAEAWDLERAFWLEGASLYEHRLAPEAVVVLPGAGGVLTRPATLQAIGQSRRSEVSFESKRMLRPASNVVLLVYDATAEGARPKSDHGVRCSSMYLDPGDGQWKLALHQQTPL